MPTAAVSGVLVDINCKLSYLDDPAGKSRLSNVANNEGDDGAGGHDDKYLGRNAEVPESEYCSVWSFRGWVVELTQSRR